MYPLFKSQNCKSCILVFPLLKRTKNRIDTKERENTKRSDIFTVRRERVREIYFVAYDIQLTVQKKTRWLCMQRTRRLTQLARLRLSWADWLWKVSDHGWAALTGYSCAASRDFVMGSCCDKYDQEHSPSWRALFMIQKGFWKGEDRRENTCDNSVRQSAVVYWGLEQLNIKKTALMKKSTPWFKTKWRRQG